MLSRRTLAFSCGARSASELKGIRLLEKHAIAPSAARLYIAPIDLRAQEKLSPTKRKQTNTANTWITMRRVPQPAILPFTFALPKTNP